MKKILLVALLATFFFSGQSQTLDFENEFVFKSLKKDSYLGNVEYNADDKTTSLYYVEKDMFKSTFTTYVFDENLNFVKEESESFNIIDQIGAAFETSMDIIRGKYSWFNYRGESYTKEWVTIAQLIGGKIGVAKQKVTFNYNWDLGVYIPKLEKTERTKIKGENEERIYLYDHVVNTESGEAYLLVGLKAEKGTKDKYQHARKFQIVKITNELEAVFMEEISFDYNMAISFKSIQYKAGYAPNDELEVDDIFNGKLYMVFSPIKTPLGKKFNSPTGGENTMVVVDENGKIETKIDYTTETTGWVIEAMVASSTGDLFFYGPAKDEVYVNKVMPTNSPLTSRSEVKDIKWKNFQVMKITNNNLVWIKSTELDEFEEKAVAPPSQKQMPIYKGKKFVKTVVYVTPSGELIIGGQNYTMKNIPDPNSNVEGAKIKVIDQYKDLVMFHFDNKGSLKATYGVRRDKMNKYSKSMVTPQDVYMGPDGQSVYWVYGEIKGMRKGFEMGGIFEVAGVGTISKRKLLYYPAVAQIDLRAGTVNDFISLGADSEGKQKYYTNPSFPQLLAPNGSSLTFVGEDKKGSLIWLGRMNLK